MKRGDVDISPVFGKYMVGLRVYDVILWIGGGKVRSDKGNSEHSIEIQLLETFSVHEVFPIN